MKWVWIAAPLLLLAGLLVVLELDTPSLMALDGARMTDFHNRKGTARWHYESDRSFSEVLEVAHDDLSYPNWNYTRSSSGRSALFTGLNGEVLMIFPAGAGCGMIYGRPSQPMDTPRQWVWYVTHPGRMFDKH